MSSSEQESHLRNWQKNETLLSLAPYKVEWVDNTYKFTTESGLTYSVYFYSEVRLLYSEYENWSRNVYEIGFDVEGGLPDDFKHDPKIEETIIEIVGLFFQSHDNILFYVCETLDALELLRCRLFNQWFYRHNKAANILAKLDYKGNLGGTDIYTSFIFRKSHPYVEEIKEAFNKVCKEIYVNP